MFVCNNTHSFPLVRVFISESHYIPVFSGGRFTEYLCWLCCGRFVVKFSNLGINVLRCRFINAKAAEEFVLSIVVRRASIAKYGSELSFLHFQRDCLIVWIVRSTRPLLWGYSKLEVSWWKSHLFANCLYCWDENSGPLSLMTNDGIPWRLKMLFV